MKRELANTADQSANLLAAITRAAGDPSVDVDKMERLLAMARTLESDRARRAYAKAKAEFQRLAPVVPRNREIAIRGVVQSRYAALEDIIAATGHLLAELGFSISWDSTFEGRTQTVVCTLLHEDGHSESARFSCGDESSGSKNPVQAVASAMTYGKRYALSSVLGIVTAEEDDDAFAAASAKSARPEAAPAANPFGGKPVPATRPAIAASPPDQSGDHRQGIHAEVEKRCAESHITPDQMEQALCCLFGKDVTWTALTPLRLSRILTPEKWAQVMAAHHEQTEGGEDAA